MYIHSYIYTCTYIYIYMYIHIYTYMHVSTSERFRCGKMGGNAKRSTLVYIVPTQCHVDIFRPGFSRSNGGIELPYKIMCPWGKTIVPSAEREWWTPPKIGLKRVHRFWEAHFLSDVMMSR